MRRTLVTAVAAAVLLAGCSLDEPERVMGGGDMACAALVDYDGHRYVGHGDLKRDPETTGRIGSGTTVGCDDGNGAAPDRHVEVTALADVPPRQAVLVEGQLYVRVDQPVPETVASWMEAPSCDSAGRFELRGDWISVKTSHRPRFDGDLRPPYRVGVHVTEGPQEYVGATIRIRVTEATEPAIGPKDVKSSLWEGGGLVAEVRCQDGGFVATALTSTPG
jgi:hypothetical protein